MGRSNLSALFVIPYALVGCESGRDGVSYSCPRLHVNPEVVLEVLEICLHKMGSTTKIVDYRGLDYTLVAKWWHAD